MSIRRPIGTAIRLARHAVPVDPSVTYRNVGILNHGRGLFEKPALEGSGTKYPVLFRLGRGQLTYSKLFAWEGSVAVVSREFEGAYVSSEFPTFDVDDAVADPSYLRHATAWAGFVDQLAGLTSGLGQRRQRVNIDQFLSAVVPLPELPEQRRIAAHLDRCGHVTEQLGPSAVTSALPVSLRDRLTQGEDSSRVPLSRILTPRFGEPVRPEVRYPIAGVYSFGRGLLRRADIAGSETKYPTLTQLQQGNVVFSKLGAFENAVAVVGPEYHGSFVSPEFPVFEVDESVDADYLFAALTTTEFAERLGAAATGVGARQRRVSASTFLGLDVPLPDLQRQRNIASTLRSVARLQMLGDKRRLLSDAVLPAARNEVFSAMR